MQRTLLTLTLLVLGSVAIWFGLNRLQQTDVTVAFGQLSVSSSQIDFGDIDQAGGVVSKTIEITNTGSETLNMNRISTSCGCTTATMDTSPLSPGEIRSLTITFDPMVHPDQSGPLTRVVYLQSSDPNHPEVEINVIGNVIPKTIL